MASIKPGSVLVEMTDVEIALVRRALKTMQEYAGYRDQGECDMLSQLRLDLAVGSGTRG